MPLAEIYVNRLYDHDPKHPVQRWWVNPDILVGGSVCDHDDWLHLKSEFGIRSVLNVETALGEDLNALPLVRVLRVPDDGTPFPAGTP
jgi:hypothetical protein